MTGSHQVEGFDFYKRSLKQLKKSGVVLRVPKHIVFLFLRGFVF